MLIIANLLDPSWHTYTEAMYTKLWHVYFLFQRRGYFCEFEEQIYVEKIIFIGGEVGGRVGSSLDPSQVCVSVWGGGRGGREGNGMYMPMYFKAIA